MAVIWEVPKRPTGQNYTSDRRLFLTESGEVVEEGDPRAHSLLVGKGCSIAHDVAMRHGLFTESAPGEDLSSEDDMGTEAKRIAGPPQTKDVKGPKETKHAKDFYSVGGGASEADDQAAKK